jgi:hypothetical protein
MGRHLVLEAVFITTKYINPKYSSNRAQYTNLKKTYPRQSYIEKILITAVQKSIRSN